MAPVSNIGKPVPATAGITSGRMGSSTEYASNPIESRLNSSGPHAGRFMDDLNNARIDDINSSALGAINPMQSQYSRGNARAMVG